MRAPVATAIAIAVGIIVLLGYFLPLPLLQGVRVLLLGWGVILAGIATLIGILNLLGVHLRKLTAPGGKDYYSVFLILAFIITFVLGMWLTPGDTRFQHVITSIQVPVETSLLAILTVVLALASVRLLQRRKGWVAILFIISAVVFLFLNSGLSNLLGNLPLFGTLTQIAQQFPLAGARGILLGIALGSLTTGLRILLGADRPYSG
jgi:hypothetical protein